MVKICLVLQEITKLSTKVCMPFCIPNSKCFCCFIVSTAFGFISVINFFNYNRCEVISLVRGLLNLLNFSKSHILVLLIFSVDLLSF